MKSKLKDVIGEARGMKFRESIFPFQESVVNEQINTAKKNIVKKFESCGVNENEIKWDY